MRLPASPHALVAAVTVALAAWPGGAAAQAPAPAVPTTKPLIAEGPTGRRLLDGDWYFRLDPQGQGLSQGFFRPGPLTGWTRVRVPYAWNATDLSEASQRGSIGWYRKDFRLPASRPGSRWAVRFESVNYRARVYVNGHEAGRHEGGYIPFEVELGRFARRGTNTLVVRADNRRGESDLPPSKEQDDGTPGGGWWNYGGLLREAYLRPLSRIDVAEVQARPVLPCRACDAAVVVRGLLRNPGGGKRKARLSVSIGGHSASSRAIEVPSGGQREVTARVSIPDPRIWDVGDPDLYSLRASAVVGRSTYGSYRARIGIRSLRVSRGGRFLLNGRAVRAFGASVHEDHPELGAALYPAQIANSIRQLRELGSTITRSHYPLHPLFLEMADREGLLVWDQIPFYRYGDDQLSRRSVREKGLRYLEDTIRRDSNHPSVIAWSIANELPARPNPGQQRYIRLADRLADRLDPSRLTAIDFAGYPSIGRVAAYRPLDALGVNSYFGWYPGPAGTIADRADLSPYLDQLHRYYPRKALFITEFGAEANRSGPADEKGTYEFQSEFMRHHLSTYASKPWVNGAVAWILRDFRVRPGWEGGNPKPEPPVNQKGLIAEDGSRKPAFFDTQRLYRSLSPFE